MLSLDLRRYGDTSRFLEDKGEIYDLPRLEFTFQIDEHQVISAWFHLQLSSGRDT